nr:hypothetical protein Iba_chr01aCG6380 [Ipomoea batatas]
MAGWSKNLNYIERPHYEEDSTQRGADLAIHCRNEVRSCAEHGLRNAPQRTHAREASEEREQEHRKLNMLNLCNDDVNSVALSEGDALEVAVSSGCADGVGSFTDEAVPLNNECIADVWNGYCVINVVSVHRSDGDYEAEYHCFCKRRREVVRHIIEKRDDE